MLLCILGKPLTGILYPWILAFKKICMNPTISYTSMQHDRQSTDVPVKLFIWCSLFILPMCLMCAVISIASIVLYASECIYIKEPSPASLAAVRLMYCIDYAMAVIFVNHFFDVWCENSWNIEQNLALSFQKSNSLVQPRLYHVCDTYVQHAFHLQHTNICSYTISVCYIIWLRIGCTMLRRAKECSSSSGSGSSIFCTCYCMSTNEQVVTLRSWRDERCLSVFLVLFSLIDSYQQASVQILKGILHGSTYLVEELPVNNNGKFQMLCRKTWKICRHEASLEPTFQEVGLSSSRLTSPLVETSAPATPRVDESFISSSFHAPPNFCKKHVTYKWIFMT